MNHRKLPLNLLGMSDAEFQQFHERHLVRVKNTRSVENMGHALLHQKPCPSYTQLSDFSKLVFSWGGKTGGRVRWRTLQVPPKNFRYAFLTALFYIRADNFFLTLLPVQTIKGLKSFSYASKHLRFLWPERYGVLDSIINTYLRKDFPNHSRFHLLHLYCTYCQEKAVELSKKHLLLGDYLPSDPAYPVFSSVAKPWKAADVDMAVFAKLKGW